VLIGVVAGAGLACPLHMWWRQRRGGRACCVSEEPAAPVERRIETLRAQIAELDADVNRATAAE
jgi:hypothetical protein